MTSVTTPAAVRGSDLLYTRVQRWGSNLFTCDKEISRHLTRGVSLSNSRSSRRILSMSESVSGDEPQGYFLFSSRQQSLALTAFSLINLLASIKNAVFHSGPMQFGIFEH